ncbi:hypothetical protein [Enterobacter soli]|uniref:hypothetical protein n=1 Tax=Enterobacter soli TaxID=885040 RepID=UPI000FFE7C19|nr:hypothetical protein [Enterobacter soli]
MPNDSIIVIDIAGNPIKIRVFGQNLIDKMKLIGFSTMDQFMILSVHDDEDKQRVIKTLINENALFLYGHGWYPSEVMEYYKEQKNNFGKYKIIYWTDIDTYHIEER